MSTTSANAAPESPLAGGPAMGRSLWGDAWRRIWRDRSAVACMAVICLFVAVAIGATVYEVLAERVDRIPTFQQTADASQRDLPPSMKSWKYLLGTDWGGKSVLVKTLLAAKVSLTVGLMANVIAVPLGMILGAVAGYYGGRIDSVIVWLFSTLASIPGIVLLIALKYAFKDVSIFGLDLSGIHGVYIALGVISWIGTCRLVRAETMKIRELDYVLAARASGARGLTILLRHVIPNVSHLGIISFSLGFIGAIKAEVFLSYLGLGVGVGTPSWGNMISGAREQIYTGKWWELTAAVGAMFVLVLALNIFGDRLRDALDPRLKTA